ncbi:MAG TPA: hypothetical protein GX405_04495 [Rhizobiales bacterium]|nr:hypothetical protein [Hyphomicrobiales bacterium]
MQGLAAAVSVMLPPAVAWEGPAVAAVLQTSTFPEIVIRKDETPHERPFPVDEGTRAGAEYGGRQTVIFSEPWRTVVPQEFADMTQPCSVIVSADPFALLASHEDRDVHLPFDGIETLTRRLAPFETMGRAPSADGQPPEKEI